MDCRPVAPIAAGPHAAMLDSGGMPRSEDHPPTLASLRTRRGIGRARRSPPPAAPKEDLAAQSDLFDSLAVDRVDDFLPVAAEVSSEKPPTPIGWQRNVAVPPAGAAELRVWSVRGLVLDIQRHVENKYENVWVEGEISNCRIAPSGHVYFTLKDDEAQLPVVLFRRQVGLLRFRLTDGLAVWVRGRVSLYESRGQLQLIAETIEPRGAGALQLAFEQLKARLLAEGLFDAARKRPLPAFPKCIGVVTSPAGAVIRDILTIVRRRHARLNLLIYPATMQGVSSPDSVADGIRWFNANSSLVDLIVIARGGGSPEDLAGFNDEALARAIAGSALPVLSAIGHETDFTIADFAADLRAPTPSAAAELITTAQHRVEERVQALTQRVPRAGRYHLLHARQRYARLSAESVLTRLRDAVNRRDQRIDDLHHRLASAAERCLRLPTQRLALLTARLRRQDIAVRIATTERRLQSANERLHRASTQTIATRQTRLNQASARLDALSPLAVLNRGYALIYLQNQNQAGPATLLRSAADTIPGDTIQARLAQGTLTATVTQTKMSETNASEKSNK